MMQKKNTENTISRKQHYIIINKHYVYIYIYVKTETLAMENTRSFMELFNNAHNKKILVKFVFVELELYSSIIENLL